MIDKSRIPTSPYWIYQWRYTFFNASVIHRATGLALTFGLFFFVYWLIALSEGPSSYARAMKFFSHPAFKFFLAGLTWSFAFHFLAGVRHLFFDAGYGFERKDAAFSRRLVVFGSFLIAVIALIFMLRGGAPMP